MQTSCSRWEIVLELAWVEGRLDASCRMFGRGTDASDVQKQLRQALDSTMAGDVGLDGRAFGGLVKVSKCTCADAGVQDLAAGRLNVQYG